MTRNNPVQDPAFEIAQAIAAACSEVRRARAQGLQGFTTVQNGYSCGLVRAVGLPTMDHTRPEPSAREYQIA